MPARSAAKKASAAKGTTAKRGGAPPRAPRAAKSTKTTTSKVAAGTRARKGAASPRNAKSGPGPDLGSVVAALESVTATLASSWKGVAGAIEEIPRTADLQPLADHLYEFAVAAPKLMESIRQLPEALAPVERAGLALQEINETLEGTQATLQDALFHMPRPSEYEPLAEPLRDFARLSPSLIEALASMPRASALLEQATRRIEESTERLARSPDQGAPEAARNAIGRARASIEAALASIPDESAYAPLARQLRELASVSPSLMEWLSEAPRLSAPLARAVTSLRAAAEDLALAEAELAGIDAASRPA